MTALVELGQSRLLDQLLALIWYALLIGIPVYAAGVLITYLAPNTLHPGLHLRLDVPIYPAPDALALAPQGSVARAATIPRALATISLTRLPAVDLAVLLAAWVLKTALWLPVLYQLRKLFTALLQGRPFVSDNAIRLRILGVVLLGAELLRAALWFGQGVYIWWAFDGIGLRLYPLNLNLNTTTLFVGAALIVAAEAFRRGAELEEDQALTV
jgi:hypothetical protein